MICEGAVTAPVVIGFLRRLIRNPRGKIFLILDRLAAHRARQVHDWLAAHRAQIEVFYLPPYSPELNPEEGLNADLKQAGEIATAGPCILPASAIPLCRLISRSPRPDQISAPSTLKR